ncbi:MAG: DUF1292 domain-containing protein [Clostridia bacterium]|nr:DUF1292 domain-containing protein [Clostridia bacterium]
MDEENIVDSEFEEEDSNIVILNDEDGNEIRFEFLDLIEYESEEYVVLLPVDEDGENEDGEVVILKLEDSEGEEESYVSVDDENVLTAVFEIFKDKFKDEFNFTDDAE